MLFVNCSSVEPKCLFVLVRVQLLCLKCLCDFFFQSSLAFVFFCRKTFSRRRMFIEDENVGYINEYNRSFNKKLARAFGAQSLEIRQNLERGTAL